MGLENCGKMSCSREVMTVRGPKGTRTKTYLWAQVWANFDLFRDTDLNSASSTFSMAFFSNSRLCLPQKVLDIIVVVWIVAITWLCRQCQQVDNSNYWV